jgi:DNA ligase (NAD+)
VDDLLQLEGFQTRSAQNVIDGIRESASRGLSRVLVALGIRHVGETAAQLIARAFGSMERLLEASAADVLAIHGIGETTAQALVSYLAEPRNREIIEKLRRGGVDLTEPQAPAADGPFAGTTVVITGTLPTLSRKQAQQLIEEAGGRVTGSVTGATDYLLVGEDAGSKLARARELGVQELHEDDLLSRLGRTATRAHPEP